MIIQAMMVYIIHEKVIGEVEAYVLVIERQKSGSSHAHCMISMPICKKCLPRNKCSGLHNLSLDSMQKSPETP